MKLICIFPFKTKSPFCIDSIFIVINKNYQLKQKQNKKTVDVKDNQTSESCTKVPAYSQGLQKGLIIWCIVRSFNLFFTQEVVSRTRTRDLSIT